MWIEFEIVKANICSTPTDDLFSDISMSQLATRGWAAQETILSTRQIVFGKSNVHFICPWASQSNGCPLSFGAFNATIHRTRAEKNPKNLYSEWVQILDGFNNIKASSFTYATDLLPSISGLAAYFAKRLNDYYFAGHWGNDLIISLMWMSEISFRVSKPVYLDRICSPNPYLVPSWSQLSSLGSITSLRENCWYDSFHSEVNYIGARTVLNGSNVFGAIKNAELRVRGHCMSLQSTKTIQLVSTSTYAYWNHGFNAYLLKFKLYDGKDLFCRVSLDYGVLPTEIHEEAMVWKWILLGICKQGPSGISGVREKEENMYPFGLLVHRVKRTKWCRVGIFWPDEDEQEDSRLSLEIFEMASELEDNIII
jgi:hypothetical protein